MRIYIICFCFIALAIVCAFTIIPICDFFIFRNEPYGFTFISDGNKRLKGSDVVKMYEHWCKDKNSSLVSDKFKKIFENVINMDDSGFHAYYLQTEKNKKSDIVIFLHGVQCCIFTDDFTDENYRNCILKNIKDDFDILIVEHPGLSINKNQSKYDFEQMLNVTNKWLEKNYSDKKKILVGHSFGCYLALRCANLSKNKYDGIIIVNPFKNLGSAIEHVIRHDSKKLWIKLLSSFMKHSIKYSFDCIKEIKKVKNNLILIKLEKDMICPPNDAIILSNNFNKDDNYTCKVVDVAKYDSSGKSYYRHEYPNVEQIKYFAKCFQDKDFDKIYPKYEEYRYMLSNSQH